jgi:hypothetical protein
MKIRLNDQLTGSYKKNNKLIKEYKQITSTGITYVMI